MKDIKTVMFRYLTDADFFNIYKPTGSEETGGGQSYIDFQVPHISIAKWDRFFDGVTGLTRTMRKKGPCWHFPVHSAGMSIVRNVEIYQRRAASVCISSQKLTSGKENRVDAWRPEHGFPNPPDPENRRSLPPGLGIYLVRTYDGEVWAGWFQGTPPCRTTAAISHLREMFDADRGDGHANCLEFEAGVLIFDESDKLTPFISTHSVPKARPASPASKPRRPSKGSYTPKPRTEKDITDALFDEDMPSGSAPKAGKPRTLLRKVLERNSKAISLLKALYGGKCQLTGYDYTFRKEDGAWYSEGHHLKSLGKAGADSPFNIIVVSPLIHRMLHYATVTGLDLDKISSDHTLQIRINGKTYAIRWHPLHAESVRDSAAT